MKMEKAKETSSVTFDIIFDDSEVKREPRRMVLMKNKQNKKEPLTADEIKKRQILAEERRQARLEARLQRMREREESARKLAHIFLQHSSLKTGQTQKPDKASVTSYKEILKTASNVVKEFDEMRVQLLNMTLKLGKFGQFPETKWQRDLKISKTGKMMQRHTTENSKPSKVPAKNPLSEVSSNTDEQKHEGIAFEIPFNDMGGSKKCKKKPPIASLRKKYMGKEKQQMVALKLEEKQRKAAQRRMERQDDKVRRTRESREALMELCSKVNIFQQHQAAVDGKADPGMMLSGQEAASLAHDIADGFSNMHSRYTKDLERAEGFFMVYEKALM